MAQEEFLDEPMPDILAQWRYYFSLLAPRPGDSFLDVGCNSGDAIRLLLREYPEIGHAVGIDNDPQRLERATAKWRGDGSPGRAEFLQADARALPFPDASFARVICAETLEWVKPPAQGLAEIRRVLNPGGIAAIIHTDFATQVFHCADQALCRQIVLAFCDDGPDGQIGRKLYGLCRQAGFGSVEPHVYPLVDTAYRTDGYALKVAAMMTKWLRSKDLIGEEEMHRWLADLAARDREGTFFYSVNRNICRCRK